MEVLESIETVFEPHKYTSEVWKHRFYTELRSVKTQGDNEREN